MHTQQNPEAIKLAAEQQQVEPGLDKLHMLAGQVGEKMASISDTAYGSAVESMRSFSHDVGVAESACEAGDTASGQRILELGEQPKGMKDGIRDALAEMHQTERGEITAKAKKEAFDFAQLQIAAEVNHLTDPKGEGLAFTDEKVQELKRVDRAFAERHRDYFDEQHTDGQIMGTEEERTPHEVAEDAYTTLLEFAETKLRDKDMPNEEVEAWRTARDALHIERMAAKSEFDKQTQVIDRLTAKFGMNEQVNVGALRELARESVGEQLGRLEHITGVIEDSDDLQMSFNTINRLQRDGSLVQDETAFNAWIEQQAKRGQLAEQANKEQSVKQARELLTQVHNQDNETEITAGDQGKEVNEMGAEDTASPIVESEEVKNEQEEQVEAIAEEPDTKLEDATSQQVEKEKSPTAEYIKRAVSRVPRREIVAAVNDIAKERAKVTNQEVDAEALLTEIGSNLMDGNFAANEERLQQLATAINENGFAESGGGLWEANATANSEVAKIANEARSVLRMTLKELVGK